MTYLYIKSLHIIFITTWFAGLFYIIRLFIYYKEAEEKPEIEKNILLKQYKLMIKRLWYIITWPSAILATGFAIWLLILQPAWLQTNWMLIKLGFVALLFAYHWTCQIMYNQIEKGYLKYSSFALRIWNEVATIILFACVFLVILKNSLGWIFGVIGIVSVSILLMLGIKLYKNIRNKNNWDNN
ncbi:protoporphyrinogen IX oxidase [Lutibacter profundi]|uniref:Protoporphyrinogen IX oxidase n=1 Tax=Lutibacter profundi TaxID=1622118 RepID=A0A0X8G8J3_9FLAO|nr:CopD family protein [Lutibacter profundi]AMC12020.1 protoporphyrinogen IX oxidase [Lutibacter profundi]